MSTASHEIDVSGVNVEVIRKDIRNLHLRVYPPDGRVRVSAPRHLGIRDVEQFVVSRLGWIRRKKERIAGRTHPHPLEIVTGEMHSVEGELYPLEIIERDGQAVVELSTGKLLLRAKPSTSRTRLQAALDRWYRRRLRAAIPPLIAKLEPKIGVKVAEWHIKKMKTRWGTCNPGARRIWINLELAKRSAAQLEYIVAHEMVHICERLHNDRFQRFMDRAMPKWREHDAALKQISLAR